MMAGIEPHEFFMQKALDQANRALVRGEFPVGCVLVAGGEVVADGARRGSLKDGETDHAEIMALRRLANRHAGLDRSKITCYCTMEPCLMCFGALMIHGIHTIVYAYEDAMGGGTGCDLTRLPPLYKNADLKITPHVLREPALKLFHEFFTDPGNTYLHGTLLDTYTRQQGAKLP